MLLFANSSNVKCVIPLSRVYDISAVSCTVVINYDCGDIVEVEGTFQKKLESVRVVFDSADDVDKIMRQFFKACRAKENAFYFG